MPDAFVTLISVQPAVAVRSAAGKQQPQSTGMTLAGLYEAQRQKQVVRGKTAPPGAK